MPDENGGRGRGKRSIDDPELSLVLQNRDMSSSAWNAEHGRFGGEEVRWGGDLTHHGPSSSQLPHMVPSTSPQHSRALDPTSPSRIRLPAGKAAPGPGQPREAASEG